LVFEAMHCPEKFPFDRTNFIYIAAVHRLIIFRITYVTLAACINTSPPTCKRRPLLIFLERMC
jgi:hypothetical protein